MDITRLFRRQKRSQDRDPRRKFIGLLLERALREKATAIVFGIPHDLEWDLDAQLKDENAAEAEVAELLREPGDVEQSSGDDHAFLKFTNGADGLPVWFVVDGEYRPHMPLSLNLYPYILQMIGELLTSVDGSGFRYIELTPPDAAELRCFVEVRWTMGRDNSVRLELLQVRDVPASLRIFRPGE